MRLCRPTADTRDGQDGPDGMSTEGRSVQGQVIWERFPGQTWDVLVVSGWSRPSLVVGNAPFPRPLQSARYIVTVERRALKAGAGAPIIVVLSIPRSSDRVHVVGQVRCLRRGGTGNQRDCPAYDAFGYVRKHC